MMQFVYRLRHPVVCCTAEAYRRNTPDTLRGQRAGSCLLKAE